MSMVQLALRRPFTFIVMAILIVFATPFVLRNMATDIFPEINIPVISVIWNYNGLPAQEMGQRIASTTERGLSPADVVNAVNTQNLVLPSGTVKLGEIEYTVHMNGSPDSHRLSVSPRRKASQRSARSMERPGSHHGGAAALAQQPRHHPVQSRDARHSGTGVAVANPLGCLTAGPSDQEWQATRYR